MRHYKTVQHTIDKQVFVKTTCDKCGSVAQESKGYNTREFSLEMLRGKSFPEGGYHEGWEVDLCDKCIDWLVDVLKENGVTLQKVESDW